MNNFFNHPRTEKKLRMGLTLILDYNEDRNLVRIRGKEKKIKQNLVDNIVNFEESQEALINLTPERTRERHKMHILAIGILELASATPGNCPPHRVENTGGGKGRRD